MKTKEEFNTQPDDFTDDALNQYISKFLDIAEFKSIDNGKFLLDFIKKNPDNSRTKAIIRKVIGLFNCKVPAGRVCSLQFLKESVETGCFYVIEALQKSLLNEFAEILDYRSNIPNIQRGSTYFIKDFDKNAGDQQLMNLMKLSSTFFRMVHQCLYVWGAVYFQGSLFDKLRLKMQKKIKFPQFPKDFKFFSEAKIRNFKQNCQQLIARVRERDLNSLISKRSNSIISEGKASIGSPRKIKQAPIIPPKKPSNKQAAANGDSNQMKNSKVVRKGNPKDKNNNKSSVQQKGKQQKLGKGQNEQKIIENNSSQLRKKNSFREVPFQIQKSKQVYSPISNPSLPQLLNKQKIIQSQQMANRMSRQQQSQGGRYSIKQTDSKQQMSEILQPHQEVKTSSPKSQYQKPKLGRQISQQLPSKPQFINKNDQNTKINEKNETKTLPKKNQIKQTQETVHKQVNKVSKQSFNINLKDIEKKANNIGSKASNRRHGDSSDRKKIKFLSSEQQNAKQIQPSSQKQNTIIKKNEMSSSNQYLQSPVKQPSILKQSKRDVKYDEGLVVISKQQPLLKKQDQNKATYVEPAIKPPKPVKLKPQQNSSKSLYESTNYKVVNLQQKSRQKQVNLPKPKQNKIDSSSLQKNMMTKKQVIKYDKKSLYQAQSIDAFYDIPSVSLTNQVQLPTLHLPNASEDQNLNEESSISNKKQQNLNVDKQNSKSPLIIIQKPNVQRNVQKVKIIQKSNHKQIIPAKISQSLTTPSKYKPNLEISTSPPKLISSTQKYPSEKKEASQKQKVQQLSINKQQIQQSHQKYNQKMQSQLQSQSHRSFSANSNQNFRHFKQVNLLIQPQPQFQPPQPKKNQQEILLNKQQISQALKQQIIEEFNKLKSKILEKQQQAISNQLISLKSSIIKQSSQKVVQSGTQTKITRRSKSKFQRIGKYKILDQSFSEENKQEINIPKPSKKEDIQQTSFKLDVKKQQLPSKMQKKKSENIKKEQLKPNTLLYALYKRKLSHLSAKSDELIE